MTTIYGKATYSRLLPYAPREEDIYLEIKITEVVKLIANQLYRKTFVIMR